MHESIDESPNFTNICIFRGENAYLCGNFNVFCSVHTFSHIFSKLLPQSLKFRGWDRFDGIRRIHFIQDLFNILQANYAWIDTWKSKLHDYMLFTGRKCVTLEKFYYNVSPPYIFSRFLKTFTPIIELLRLESARRHQVNTPL
jgi:hypothetical protein